MKNKKILIVFGTRPEGIKMAPLVKAFEENGANFDMRVCVTAQHREMLDQVLSLFEITPDYDLDIMKAGQDLYDVTTKILLGMREVLDDFSPDMVLVHGDTATTFSTALASFYKQIPVGHIEAGLRTGNLYSPWPEEANRVLTSRISALHFAPTEVNKQNLLSEQIPANKIIITGNTVIDALFLTRKKLNEVEGLKVKTMTEIKSKGYEISDRKIVLVTGHRRENFGQGFLNICSALKELALEHQDVDFVYPVHLNPNVQEPVNALLAGVDNIFLIKPLDYLPFILLLDSSYLVLTDSGGIQEEAPSLGKPVIVMRDTTERPEAVDSGTVVLVGTDKDNIKKNVSRLLIDKECYENIAFAHNPYGDGESSVKIVNYLNDFFTN